MEKLACTRLLKVDVHSLVEDHSNVDGAVAGVEQSPWNMRSLVKKQQQEAAMGINQQDPYVNCNFIFGSTAAVERLWSVAKSNNLDLSTIQYDPIDVQDSIVSSH